MFKFIFLLILLFIVINIYSRMERKEPEHKCDLNLQKYGYGKRFCEHIRNKNKEEDIIISINNYIYEYIGKIDDSEIYIRDIKKCNKAIIFLVGENGSGKTTSCLKLAKYFDDSHETIVCTADTFKKSYESFYKKCNENNIDYIKVPENCIKIKSCVNFYINNFLEESKTLLIIDTSGRNLNNENLKKEIECASESIKNLGLKTSIKTYTINVVNINTDSNYDLLKICNFAIINHVNNKLLTDEILTKIKTLKGAPVLFINSNNYANCTSIFNIEDTVKNIAKRIVILNSKNIKEK